MLKRADTEFNILMFQEAKKIIIPFLNFLQKSLYLNDFPVFQHFNICTYLQTISRK